MKLYSSILEEAYAEQTIEKSKFICHIAPVSSKEEADRYISRIRKEYKDATHNVPAFIIGNKMEVKWQSDDSEPQGTAGGPILEMLAKEGLTNIVCVVTRYFGGIKLGTGGLVRAYQSSAKLALENSKVCDAIEMSILKYKIDYNTYQKIDKIKEKNFEIIEEEFSNDVVLTIGVDLEKKIELQSFMGNISNGKSILISEVETIFKKIK